MQERYEDVEQEALRIMHVLADGERVTPTSLRTHGRKAVEATVTWEALGLLLSHGYAYRSDYSQAGAHTNFAGTTRLYRLKRDGLLPTQFDERNDFRGSWHVEVERASRDDYSKGNYDSAIMQATKRLEVKMRDCSGLGAAMLGDKLATHTFKPGGPLHRLAPSGEDDNGMQMLAQGAIATFRNPTHHYDVGHNDPVEAGQILCFISYLISITERRGSEKANQAGD